VALFRTKRKTPNSLALQALAWPLQGEQGGQKTEATPAQGVKTRAGKVSIRQVGGRLKTESFLGEDVIGQPGGRICVFEDGTFMAVFWGDPVSKFTAPRESKGGEKDLSVASDRGATTRVGIRIVHQIKHLLPHLFREFLTTQNALQHAVFAHF